MSVSNGPVSQSINPVELKSAHAFLSKQTCLIVEPSQAFSMSVRACLQELGVPSAQILVASKFQMAKQMMNELRPTILITEYQVENKNGFELIEMQEAMHEESKRISFVTSKSTSTSVVVEAAEGQVDGYLLKPFSVVVFRKYFLDILKRKTEPSAYFKKLLIGRQHRDKSEFDLAFKEFEEAKKIHPKPALACYQIGETYRAMGNVDEALVHYRDGRKHMPLHYKCVTGEFEALIASSRYEEAMKLVPLIRTNFPISSPRLAQLFKTVREMRAFAELASLFAAYRELEERSASLIEIAEASFFDAGVEALKAKQTSKAMGHFDTALQISGRRFDFIEKVVGECLTEGASREADAFLLKTAPGDVGTPAYHRLSFRVNQLTMTSDQLLNKGRELVFAGHGTPEIFHIVVRSFAVAGKETMAETAIGKAVETFPELRATLYKLLADNLPKSGSNKQAA